MKLNGKVAVVTGGTGGLGWRICGALGKAGMKIVLVYLKSHQKAEQYIAELKKDNIQAFALSADITTDKGIDSVIEKAGDIFGQIDTLVLDAAFNQSIAFQDLDTLTPDLWDYILHFNLSSPFMAMRKIGSSMKKQGEGRIVTISSVAGLQPAGSSIAYCTAKAGLIHLTRCMAVALAPGVLVNCVAPGLMEGTRMTSNLTPEFAAHARDSALLKRAADKDDVADAVLTLIKTDSITGQTLVVDSGAFFH